MSGRRPVTRQDTPGYKYKPILLNLQQNVPLRGAASVRFYSFAEFPYKNLADIYS